MSTFRVARRLSETASVVEAFVGVQEDPARPVVVKRLVAPWSQAPGFAQRFLGAEQQPPRGPGLPELYELGVANDVTYLVTELIEGESLRHAMNALAQRKGFIAPAEGLAVVGRVAHLMGDLHARKPALVHGDLCASTVLITPRGEVYLLDANVAAAAGATPALGPARAEPYTLAPEQLTGEVTPATDVFRLGLLLYELALGRPLFAAQDAMQSLVTCQRFTGLTRDMLKQVPEPYASVIVHLLEASPTDRPTLEEVDTVLAQAAAKAGWRTPELDVARLFSRACPNHVGLATSLPRDGHPLVLKPLVGPRPAERPAVTPPSGAVVARIATRKMSRTELEAVRAPAAYEAKGAPAEEPVDGSAPRDLKLGLALVEKKALTQAQLDEALEQVSIYGGSLSDALQSLGTLDEDVIVTTLAELTKTPALTAKKLSDMAAQPDALKLVPLELARELDLVPLALKGGTQLMVAMKNPMDNAALDKLKAASGLKSIVAMRGGERAIRKTRNRFYTGSEEDDVGDWLERSSGPTSLLTARGSPPASASSSSGIFDGNAPLPPAPSAPPQVMGELLEAPPPLGPGDLSASAALRIAEALLGLLGDRGRQGTQLVAVAVGVAERLGVAPLLVDRVRLAATALVTSALRDGRPPWDVPTIEALSAVLGPAWDELEPLVSPLLAFPAEVPAEPERQALCAAFAFANHVGQAKPLAQVAAPALTSFKARFRFPPAAVTALAQALGVPGA